MPLLTGRETNFYGSPVTRGLVLISSVTSFVYSIFRSVDVSANIWVKCLRCVSFPTAGTWAMGVVLMYWIRPLERRLGSLKFMHTILSSLLFAAGLHISLSYSFTPLLFSVSLIYWILGVLTTHYIIEVKSTILYRNNYIQISSHIMLIGISVLIILYSLHSVFALFSGAFGAVVTHVLKPIPIPHFLLQSLVNMATKLTAGEKPPRILSGATIDIQRQQRMDLLEGFILTLQQQALSSTGNGPYVPRDDQIQQLTMMGFRRDEVYQALTSSQGDITRAIQLLTTNAIHVQQ